MPKNSTVFLFLNQFWMDIRKRFKISGESSNYI